MAIKLFGWAIIRANVLEAATKALANKSKTIEIQEKIISNDEKIIEIYRELMEKYREKIEGCIELNDTIGAKFEELIMERIDAANSEE